MTAADSQKNPESEPSMPGFADDDWQAGEVCLEDITPCRFLRRCTSRFRLDQGKLATEFNGEVLRT